VGAEGGDMGAISLTLSSETHLERESGGKPMGLFAPAWRLAVAIKHLCQFMRGEDFTEQTRSSDFLFMRRIGACCPAPVQDCRCRMTVLRLIPSAVAVGESGTFHAFSVRTKSSPREFSLEAN